MGWISPCIAGLDERNAVNNDVEHGAVATCAGFRCNRPTAAKPAARARNEWRIGTTRSRPATDVRGLHPTKRPGGRSAGELLSATSWSAATRGYRADDDHRPTSDGDAADGHLDPRVRALDVEVEGHRRGSARSPRRGAAGRFSKGSADGRAPFRLRINLRAERVAEANCANGLPARRQRGQRATCRSTAKRVIIIAAVDHDFHDQAGGEGSDAEGRRLATRGRSPGQRRRAAPSCRGNLLRVHRRQRPASRSRPRSRYGFETLRRPAQNLGALRRQGHGRPSRIKTAQVLGWSAATSALAARSSRAPRETGHRPDRRGQGHGSSSGAPPREAPGRGRRRRDRGAVSGYLAGADGAEHRGACCWPSSPRCRRRGQHRCAWLPRWVRACRRAGARRHSTAYSRSARWRSAASASTAPASASCASTNSTSAA